MRAMLGFAALAAIPRLAQTAAGLLQKGIYAQQTEGNLDNAILIYRQIVNSAPSQRDLAAEAQHRLAQSVEADRDDGEGLAGPVDKPTVLA